MTLIPLAAFLLSGYLLVVSAETSPIITNNKTEYVIPDGGFKIIYCETQGDPKPSIRWEINATGNFKFKVSKNTSLINITNNRMSEWYGLVSVTCIANNTVGTVCKTFKIVIMKAATITTDQKTYDVPDNGSSEIYLNCKATGFPSPLVSWSIKETILSKGRALNYRHNGTKSLNITVFNDGRLRILASQRSKGFGMNVTCIANNTAGDDRKTYLVRFLEAPMILTNGSKIEIFEYIELFKNIACETSGYPKPVIEWKFGNNTLNTSSHGSLHGISTILHVDGLISVSYQVFNNGTIRINNLVSTDFVPYIKFTCVARNVAGEATQTHSFYIGKLETYSFEMVLPKKELFSNLKEIVEQKIEQIYPPGLLYYSLNITSINFTNRVVRFQLTYKDEKMKKLYGDPRDTAKLAADVLTVLQIGGFHVERFQMNAPPAPPLDFTADEITSNEVTISWKPPNYFEVEFYEVQMSIASASIIRWKSIKDVNGDRKSTTLDNLDPDTKYIIRIKSRNKHGVGEKLSETLEVETKAASPVVIIVVVVILVIVVILLGMWYVYYRRRKGHRFGNRGGDNPYEESIPGVAFSKIYVRHNRTFCPTGTSDGSRAQAVFSWNEISREFLSMGEILGQGEFGLVQKAMWRDEENNRVIPVAVKTVKDLATETDRKELFKELKLMAVVGEHPNIVNLIGASAKGGFSLPMVCVSPEFKTFSAGPLLVIVEFCKHGDLLSYLKKNRKDLSPSKEGTFVTSLEMLTRLRIALDVSRGMGYLERKKVVHRDLAARNVLLGKNKIAKVSDFGLSRDIYERGLYEKKTGGKLPLKWMAIESLQEASYDSKSDVWSFGVLFWEIESAGLVPYPGIHGIDLLPRLQEDYRLPKPSETSSEIYDIMKSCWESSPKVRPCFIDLESILESYMEEQQLGCRACSISHWFAGISSDQSGAFQVIFGVRNEKVILNQRNKGYLSVIVDEEDSRVDLNSSYVNYVPN